MHKDNEYMVDKKLYVKKIKSCEVYNKTDDTFILWCHLIHRGVKIYTYKKGNLFLEKDNKKLYLTGESENTVKRTVEIFDGIIEKAKKQDEFFKAEYIKLNELYYAKRLDVDCFRFVKIFEESGKRITEIFEGSLGFLKDYKEKVALKEDGFYKYALSINDKTLQSIIKQYYGQSDEKDRNRLENAFNIKVLPRGNESINKNFVLKKEELDYKVLSKSGYVFLHRPYFAMSGSSHELRTLNPYSMCAVDAGDFNAELISWEEFVKTVNESKIQ